MKITGKYDKSNLVLGLCDDEEYIHREVERIITDYAKRGNLACQILHYYSGEELLADNTDLDFLLLDIEMPEMDGIETAFKLRAMEKEMKIVMLTAREDRYREAFKIGAFRFVPKPVEEGELCKAIDEVREHLVGMTEITVYQDGITYPIVQKNIVFVESNRTETFIYTGISEYRSEHSLSTWLELLDTRVFFQCHKSYIVNMGKIEEIGKDIVKLVTGDKIKVSRRLRTPLLQAFMRYDTSRR